MKKNPRLVVTISEEKLNKFGFLCNLKKLTKKKVVNDYLSFFIKKFWTADINKLYKEINNYGKNT
jgi:hypothetical protein